MADKNSLIEQMLEHLVNDDQQKAEELFHEYVVSKSREIYESLIEEEMKDDDDEEEDDEDTNEGFDEIAAEADDEMDLDSEDPTDDLAAELDSDDDEDEEKETDELFQDLEDIVDELQAKFDKMNTGDDMDDMDDDEEMKDDFDLETVREYVEKVPAGHGAEKKGAAEKADNTHSSVAGKNDMGGQSMKFGEEDNSDKGTAGGLSSNKAQDMKSGNVNVPGGKASTSMKKEASGHGAEKKGAAESADNKQSIFRGRR